MGRSKDGYSPRSRVDKCKQGSSLLVQYDRRMARFEPVYELTFVNLYLMQIKWKCLETFMFPVTSEHNRIVVSISIRQL